MPLRVTTANLNGIRAAARKGFFDWLRSNAPDVACFQETKAQEHQVPPEALDAREYHRSFVDAERKGYSGVAIFARRQPDAIVRGLGWPETDAEGRWLRADFGSLSIASLYVPSGTSGPARQAVKNDFLERFYGVLRAMRADGRSWIVCGDFNVAHRDIDVFDPKSCARTTGFLPNERAWFDRVIDEAGWVDAMRVVDPEPKRYTWWSNFPAAFERNLGWRIDYQLITPDLAPLVRKASIHLEPRFSDHAPLTIDYELELDALGA